MELLTHDSEDHEIGWRMVDDDDGDESPSPEPRTDSRSALPRGFRMNDLIEGIKQEGSIFFESKNIQVQQLRSHPLSSF